MENIEYDGPIAAAVVLDKNDGLQYMVLTSSQEKSLRDALPACMQRAVTLDTIEDMRVLLYDFPNIKSVPEINQDEGLRYYVDHLLPAANDLGLKPCAEIHAKELAFAMMYGERIDLAEPENSIRSRSDLGDFSCGVTDLMGKSTTIRLATGEQIEYGLNLNIAENILAEELKDLFGDKSVVERVDEAEEYKGRVYMAMVLDNQNNSVEFMVGNTHPDQTLARTLHECMMLSTRDGQGKELRVEQYTFPNPASMPEVTQENHRVFYDNIFLPTITRMGIRPDVEVHSNEVLYAMINGLTLELNKPEMSMRLREDYNAQCRTVPEKLPELIGKNLLVTFPSGLTLELGVRHDHQKQQDLPEQARHVPSMKPSKQKNSIN